MSYQIIPRRQGRKKPPGGQVLLHRTLEEAQHELRRFKKRNSSLEVDLTDAVGNVIKPTESLRRVK